MKPLAVFYAVEVPSALKKETPRKTAIYFVLVSDFPKSHHGEASAAPSPSLVELPTPFKLGPYQFGKNRISVLTFGRVELRITKCFLDPLTRDTNVVVNPPRRHSLVADPKFLSTTRTFRESDPARRRTFVKDGPALCCTTKGFVAPRNSGSTTSGPSSQLSAPAIKPRSGSMVSSRSPLMDDDEPSARVANHSRTAPPLLASNWSFEIANRSDTVVVNEACPFVLFSVLDNIFEEICSLKKSRLRQLARLALLAGDTLIKTDPAMTWTSDRTVKQHLIYNLSCSGLSSVSEIIDFLAPLQSAFTRMLSHDPDARADSGFLNSPIDRAQINFAVLSKCALRLAEELLVPNFCTGPVPAVYQPTEQAYVESPVSGGSPQSFNRYQLLLTSVVSTSGYEKEDDSEESADGSASSVSEVMMGGRNNAEGTSGVMASSAQDIYSEEGSLEDFDLTMSRNTAGSMAGIIDVTPSYAGLSGRLSAELTPPIRSKLSMFSPQSVVSSSELTTGTSTARNSFLYSEPFGSVSDHPRGSVSSDMPTYPAF
eukprot:Blabericola_migrator_1__2861@NODE_181_length_11864_cov_121_034161_g157_i0_p3_GENE_NODE_181_length_11864_cov_121_034161_g157_i0NODE_181_length_11864_cov_121_034161_g157_i0_p3_ORF_typecomplete_len541_score55_41_NODE_181_length_11864_cov_121_034161_g157_i029494571